MQNFLLLLQSLIDEEREDPIEYHDIKYVLRDTNINHHSYYILKNSLLSCLNVLWVTCYSLNENLKQEFKEFILKNQTMLVSYSQNELMSVLSTLKRTIERYNRGEAFQDVPELLEEEIHGNIYMIRAIMDRSDFVFDLFEIKWLNRDEIVQSIDSINMVQSNDVWIRIHEYLSQLKSILLIRNE